MKSRLLWLAILVVLAAVGASFLVPRRAKPSTPVQPPLASPQFAPPPLPAVTVPPPPAPRIVTAVPPPVPTRVRPPGMTLPLEIPIQDHTTIDFSIGAPVIRSGDADTAALERALKNMEEATKDRAFGPKPAVAPADAPTTAPVQPVEPKK